MRRWTANGATARRRDDQADAYADRVVLVSRGVVVADGAIARVRSLISGRTVPPTLPGADVRSLESHPDAQSVERRGDSPVIVTRDSDGLTRHRLTRTAARDLEITSSGLEDAFLSLTTEAAPS